MIQAALVRAYIVIINVRGDIYKFYYGRSGQLTNMT